MPNAEFTALLRSVGWTAKELAHRVNCDERTARGWRTGERLCPAPIVLWMQSMALWLRDNPAPDFQVVRHRPGPPPGYGAS